MDALQKLLRKISQPDRERLLVILEKLIVGDLSSVLIQKIQASDLFRIRVGRFRIIFHYNAKRDVVIDTVRLRNEGTYRTK